MNILSSNRRRVLGAVSGLAAAVILLAAVLGQATTSDAGDRADGRGWTMTRLELDVTVYPDRERLELSGTMALRLDAVPESFGPTLLVNMRKNDAGEPVMTFSEASASDAEVELAVSPKYDQVHEARVRFKKPRKRGATTVVRFTAVSNGRAQQIVVDEAGALASWTAGWHPFTNSSDDENARFGTRFLSVPGTMTLRLPSDWVGLVDGDLLSRDRSPDGTVEKWSTPEGIARSFVAGPYEVSTERVGDRDIRIYLLPGQKAFGRQALAGLVAGAMDAQEQVFGAFPFPSYSVAEFDERIPDQRWYAASQQTFITAKSSAFDHEHGNLPLWGHEMAHAWWGNTVGTRGAGAKWCGESLAQLGAYVAIEALDGRDALHAFLDDSRSGYSPFQCAVGYFSMVRQGKDKPIATMGTGPDTHNLADSKGSWIYHMLRRQIGDEVFFAVLRDLIDTFAHRKLGEEDIRARFIAAAPEHDLEAFFAQWLDRTGAPVIDVDWSAASDGEVELVLTQIQTGPAFVFDLDVAIELGNGSDVVKSVAVRRKRTTVKFETPARATGVHLDPHHHLLIWRPAYGDAPGEEPESLDVPDWVKRAVVGHYRFREMEKDVKVFVRHGHLFVQPAGASASRMLYEGDGTFRVDMPGTPIVQRFDLSKTPAPSFVAKEGVRDYVADRVEAE